MTPSSGLRADKLRQQFVDETKIRADCVVIVKHTLPPFDYSRVERSWPDLANLLQTDFRLEHEFDPGGVRGYRIYVRR
jgi:hypothetical protein